MSIVFTLPESKAAAKRRWRLCFSLRTLVLFVLTVASAATLWWNWGPWGVAYVITEKHPVVEAGFTRDGRTIRIATQYEDKLSPGGYINDYMLYDAATRKLNVSIPRSGSVEFSPGGTYFWTDATQRSWGAGGFVPPKWNGEYYGVRLTATGADVALSEGSAANIHFSKNDQYMCILTRDNKSPTGATCRISRMQKDEEVLSAPAESCRLSREKWAALSPDRNSIRLISLQTGKELWTRTFDRPIRNVSFLPGERIVLVSNSVLPKDENYQPPHSTTLFEAETGRLLAEFEGWVESEGTSGLPPPWTDDGTLLTTQTKESTAVWDVASARRLLAVPGDWQLIDGGVLVDQQKMEGRNARTGETIWKRPEFEDCTWATDPVTVAPCLLHAKEGSATCTVDARTGQTMFDLGELRWRWRMPYRECWANFNPEMTQCVCSMTYFFRHLENQASDNRAVVLRRIRPEQWYGPAWLPEFWLTVLCAGGLLWSIFKKSKHA